MGVFFKKYKEGKYKVYEARNNPLYFTLVVILVLAALISPFIKAYFENSNFTYTVIGIALLFILADGDLFMNVFSMYFKKIKIIKEGKPFGKIRYKFEV